MSSAKKGNQLEEGFYNYLLDQQDRGDLVYGVINSKTCKILRKKKYFCNDRKADVEFDVVIEIYRENSDKPFSYVVFECKNYTRNIPETCVTEFSDKLGRIFKHAAKGVLVVSTRLQSGADNIARSRSMGIAKYDDTGLEVVAERIGWSCLETPFVQKQIFQSESFDKSLKFSACYDGKFFGSISQFLCSLEPALEMEERTEKTSGKKSVQYLHPEEIEKSAQEILNKIGYQNGAVDLKEICSELDIEIEYSHQKISLENGSPILGSANFDRRLIIINHHDNPLRERFTLGHEIGHFYLKHNRYLRSETIAKQDLFIDRESEKSHDYQRLEFQANSFASNLILPNHIFYCALHAARGRLDIRDRGHGYVFVDDQPCNYLAYHKLQTELSEYFEVSKQAIEIKLKKLGLLTDHRRKYQNSPASSLMENVIKALQE